MQAYNYHILRCHPYSVELGLTKDNNQLSYCSHFETIMQAYNYHGETLLAQDKCGEAIGCLQESQKCERHIIVLLYDIVRISV